MQDELGLNVYDLGSREYMPDIGRLTSVDTKAQEYYNQTPYALAVNNPVFFVDINGEGVLTDYKVLTTGDDKGKIVRADPNDGSEKNETDRILETDRKGNVKKDGDGNSRVAIDNIHKGIIKEGMNMRNSNTSIEYGGKDQPTENDVVKFIVQFSEKIANSEISGFETIKMNTQQKVLYTEPYLMNSLYENFSQPYSLSTIIPGTLYIVMAHFHSHPDSPIVSDAGIDAASIPDLNGQEMRNQKGGAGFSLPHYIYNKNGRKPY